MALIARQTMKQHPGPSRFRGFDLSHRHYEIETFECPHCSNACEIKKVTLEGEEPLYYGARCDRYNVKKEAAARSSIPDLFKERMQLLMKDDWIGDDRALTRREGPIVGIPRFLVNFDLMPFWKTFFKALGIQAVLSSPTSTKLVHQGMEYLANEPCFPVKVAHGHVHDLRGKKIDFLFLPSIINMDRDDPRQQRNFLCPYIQTIPYTLTSALGLREEEMLHPVLHFADGPKRLAGELAAVAEPLRRTRAEIRKAAAMAWDALMQFREAMQARGREILESPLPEAPRLVVIVGRAYNTCDPGLNLDLPKKLRNLGACPVPMDMLPLAQEDISADFPNMYWKYGQRILKASRVIRKNPRLAAIYLTNFSCGPTASSVLSSKNPWGTNRFSNWSWTSIARTRESSPDAKPSWTVWAPRTEGNMNFPIGSCPNRSSCTTMATCAARSIFPICAIRLMCWPPRSGAVAWKPACCPRATRPA
jgi:predicted nucleotide-binding protein (sugar kinase/HSP70/actin superfamily)